MMLETCFGTLAEIYEASRLDVFPFCGTKKKLNKNKNKNKERKLNSRL